MCPAPAKKYARGVQLNFFMLYPQSFGHPENFWRSGLDFVPLPSMDRKVSYIVAIISDFAERYGLTTPQAYRYLALYKGIDFLDEFYDVEHTLSFDDVVKDVALLCRNNGGALS